MDQNYVPLNVEYPFDIKDLNTAVRLAFVKPEVTQGVGFEISDVLKAFGGDESAITTSNVSIPGEVHPLLRDRAILYSHFANDGAYGFLRVQLPEGTNIQEFLDEKLKLNQIQIAVASDDMPLDYVERLQLLLLELVKPKKTRPFPS